MSVVEDTRGRLQLAQAKLKAADEYISRSLAALDEGLLADIHGTPCHELVRQSVQLASTHLMLANAVLDLVDVTMGKASTGTL